MNGLTREKVKASGYKQAFLADIIDVHPQFFSMVMRGDRNLSTKKEALLKEFLKDVALPQSTTV